ncbi:hypothetical protein [Caballeronia sp. J97]|uniref:hypothetical protein n=1 Tax=Caballeronia sp. J97 TaxID=2805429 RepID=UPI002AB18A8D|nr:hypothetical protein [Caballeronia sp. J97]
MSFPEWGYSYNALYVPLTGGWHCALMPAHEVQEVDRSWRLPFEERKQKRKEQNEQIEQDRQDFDRLFKLRIDRRRARSCSEFREYVAFISRYSRVPSWDLRDGAGITRALRTAVRDRYIIPVIARNWHGGQRVFRHYAPQRWTASAGGGTYREPSDVITYSEFKALQRANGELGVLDSVADSAGLTAARDLASSGSGFDWMSVIEAAGGAVAGGALAGSDADSSDNSMLESFGDSDGGKSLFGDAQPFEYQPDSMSGNSFEVAARGVKMTGNEPGGFTLNPNGLDTDFFDVNGNLTAQYHESHGDAHGHNFYDGVRDPAHLPMSSIPRR